MKYNILTAFREHLHATIANKNTANTYYNAVNGLFADMQFSELSQIPESEIARLLGKTRQQSRFSAAKKGLEHLKSFDKSLNLPDSQTLQQIGKHRKNRSVKPPKIIDTATVRRKVNAIRDDKLKSAYRLMEKSGLRVSECAELKKSDFRLDNGVLSLDVRKGKGGSNDVVHTIEDKWLSAKLQEILSPLNADDKPFYSAQTMKNRAAKYGLECHDFRRIAANEYRDSLLDEGTPRADANAATQGFMRHSRFSTTKRYLANRKLSFSSKKSQGISKKRLTTGEKCDMIDSSEVNMISNIETPIEMPIEQPIEYHDDGKGVPSAIVHSNVGLTKRQKALSDSLPDYDSRVIVPKKSADMRDLSALTAETGDEYAMFTKGGERLIVRGNTKRVPVDDVQARELNAQGYRWSGHTHPGIERNSLFASEGDHVILDCFEQQTSVIYNSVGNFNTFEKR